MGQYKYAKEPFDIKLFVYRCLQKFWWILAGMFAGAVCIGGIYYLKNVTFAGGMPYEVTKKLYAEFISYTDEKDVTTYYTAYTWNDWVKSDYFVDGLLERLPEGMTKEEVIGYYEMTLPSDLNIAYITITHEDRETAALLARCLEEELAAFAEKREELVSIEVIDTIGPERKAQDIRTLRAFILGAVVGTFFALFGLAVKMILDEGVYFPEMVTYRYGIPGVGYADESGAFSAGTQESLEYLFQGKKTVGITAVESDLDLTGARELLENLGLNGVCIPSPLQVPEGLIHLRRQEGNLLLIRAGVGNGKAIESVLHLCDMNDVPVTAVLLMDADSRLIGWYRFGNKVFFR